MLAPRHDRTPDYDNFTFKWRSSSEAIQDDYDDVKSISAKTAAPDLTIEAVNVLIVAISGSGAGEFLAPLLSTIPKSLLIEEPVKYDEAFMHRMNRMKDIFECHFDDVPTITCLFHGSGLANDDKVPCVPKTIRSMCLKSPFRMIKTTQVTFQQVEEFLSMFKTNVILVLRDPRALIHSLLKRDVLSGLEEKEVAKNICPYFNSEVESALQLKTFFPKNVKIVKFEDLCLQPYDTMYDILDFLNLKPDANFTRLLDRHLAFYTGQTREAGQDIPADKDPWKYEELLLKYNGQMDSKQKAIEWVEELDPDIKSHIDVECKSAIQSMKYHQDYWGEK